MNPIKLAKGKGLNKTKKEKLVLFGLVELYLKTGKPIGSNTLREAGFEGLSSATIRNYFASLEQLGYLEQAHTSGGRVPNAKAFRLYAEEYALPNPIPPKIEAPYTSLRNTETKEIAAYLQKAAEFLSQETNLAVFFSAPRFDQDYINTAKLIAIDNHRVLCVVVTDFGVINTELLHTEEKISAFSIKRIENYFNWRLTGYDEPKNLNQTEQRLANKYYNEMLVRYVVSYANFLKEQIYRTGFSKLLQYPEFHDSTQLANTLSLFENTHTMELILKDCISHNAFKLWFGDDLESFTYNRAECVVMTTPYYINKTPVGAFGILGPNRTSYREIFGILSQFTESISEALTRNLYKFKITYRQPQADHRYLPPKEELKLQQERLLLLENKN